MLIINKSCFKGKIIKQFIIYVQCKNYVKTVWFLFRTVSIVGESGPYFRLDIGLFQILYSNIYVLTDHDIASLTNMNGFLPPAGDDKDIF